MDGIGQLAARELINDGWSALALFLAVIFAAFLVPRMRQGRGWYWDQTNQAAIALFVYFTGEVIARGWTGVLLWHFRHHVDPGWIENQYPVALIGGGVALVGALCAIRIFAPYGLRNWSWWICGAAAVAFAALMGQI